jgi:hypothetical protein
MATHNNMSIIKSSIFFLCRWSTDFTRTLAKNLNSALYMPGEQFCQSPGQERIYIVRLGKVDFYLKQKNKKETDDKIIKTLKMSLDTEVANNSFGYTAVIGRY